MGVERPWLAHYPKSVSAEIDLTRYASVVAVIDEACVRFAQRPAYGNYGRTLSYADVDRLSAQFAAYLSGTLGLAKGDRIAIMLPNILQYPIALFGALRAGLVVVNTNPLYTARELEHQLKDSGARAIVVLENFASVLHGVIANTDVRSVVVTSLGEMLGALKGTLMNLVVRHLKKMVPAWQLPGAVSLHQALALGAGHAPPQVTLNHDDLAFLQYTGGTTGVAKGAMLSHGNMVANMLQASTWIQSVLHEGEEIIVTALPLYHIFSLTANCFTFLKTGGYAYLITNPRDMPGFVKELGKLRFTAITGVNTLFNGLLNTPGFSELDFSHLRMTLGGGMAVQRAVAERWKQVTGCTLVEAYGLTETSPAVCINPLDLAAYNGSIGLPVPSTEVCVQDDSGNLLAAGEVGELCVKGPQVMRGYWNRPDETAKVMDAGGWLHTGDIARMDANGFFYIVDRKKDMILVSGFNVYPNEVEDVMAARPGVLEVAAIGVPDEKSGETVKLFVVRKNPALTEAEVRAYAKENLTGYKRPHYIEFRDNLPKTNVGKILRRELRDSAKT